MKTTKLIAAVMALSIVGGTLPFVADIAPDTAVIANAAETQVLNVLPSLKTTSSRNATIYKGDKGTSFIMNGRTYYQGIVFKKGYSSDDTYITLDVSEVKTLSWTVSHIDSSGRDNAKLRVYIDDSLEETIPLTWDMTEYKFSDLDVSKGSALKFEIEGGGCQYGLGDITTDKEKPALVSESPSYSNVGNFITNKFDNYNAGLFSGLNKSSSFNMNGRTYYQGITLSPGYSSDVTSVSYNVENVKDISFTMGHVDGKDRSSAKLNIYIDGELYEKANLTWNMVLENCEIKVPEGSKILRLELAPEGSCSYGLGDIKIDALDAGEMNSVPDFTKLTNFIDSGYNVTNVDRYTGISKGTFYNVTGRTYCQGLTFKCGYSSDSATISYNVENLDTLKFTMGRIDDSGANTATLHIYLDNVEYEKILLKPYMPIEDYELNVKDAKNVRFYLDPDGQCTYALMNISADEMTPDIDYTIPKYEKISNLTDKIFNTRNCQAFSGNYKADVFNMNGRTYYEGLVLKGSYSSDVSQVSINVEDVDNLSWTMGHIDNTGYNNGTLYVYVDEELVDTLELKWNMLLTDYKLDVSKGKVLRLFLEREGGSNYALANIVADKRKTVNDCVIPKFETAKAFLDSAYNSNFTVYNGDSPKVNKFTMNEKEYTQGLLSSMSYSSDKRYGSFNTENIKSIKCQIGHIDGTGAKNAKLYVYKNGVDPEIIALTPNMDVTEYVFDTSDAEYIRFWIECEGGCSYAMANIEITEGASTTTTTTTTATAASTTTTTSATTTTTASTTSSATTTSSVPVPASTLRGDANCDGKVDQADYDAIMAAYLAIATKQEVQLTEQGKKNADVHKDEKIDAADAVAVQFYIDNGRFEDETKAEKGDVNGDGSVNLKDVVMLRRYIAGGWGVDLDETLADVNGDGAVNLKDAVTLRRYIAGGWNVTLK